MSHRVVIGAALLITLQPIAQLAAQGTVRSPHGALRIDCGACHQADSWTSIRSTPDFDHSRTAFPLQGAHARVACRSCHASLGFTGAPQTCAGCHADLHRGEFGADCSRCHTPRSFIDRTAMVRAHAETRFPLDGSHLLADCTECHSAAPQGQLAFVGRSTRCYDCHESRYASTTNPSHAAVGFSRECADCHSTRDWTRARFDHAQAGFPLTGSHATVSCDQCHRNYTFAGGPVTCVDCHQTDYDGTTDPIHSAAQIPTDCAACHGTVTWDGARFDHDGQWFPIYSGKHRGKWSSCSQCHTVASDFTQFTCTNCHRQSDMDSHHRGIPGYGPTPQDCVRCHPQGTKP